MTDKPDPFTNLYEGQAKMARALLAPLMGTMDANQLGEGMMSREDAQQWAQVAGKLQTMWLTYQSEQMASPQALVPYFDPARWMALATDWYNKMPLAQAASFCKEKAC